MVPLGFTTGNDITSAVVDGRLQVVSYDGTSNEDPSTAVLLVSPLEGEVVAGQVVLHNTSLCITWWLTLMYALQSQAGCVV